MELFALYFNLLLFYISDVLLWTPSYGRAKQDDQQEPTYSNSAAIRGLALRTYRKQWTIEKSGEKRSGISVLMAWHDDGDDYFTLSSLLRFELHWYWRK